MCAMTLAKSKKSFSNLCFHVPTILKSKSV